MTLCANLALPNLAREFNYSDHGRLPAAVFAVLPRSIERMVFHSDPLKGDGIIEDTKTGETFPTEHVLVPMPRGVTELNIEAAIAQAITKKQNKGGAPYASGKTLVVFLNASGGEWKPTRVARNLPTHDFAAVWVVSLFNAKDGEYVYGVANLHLDIGPAPTWTVHIVKDFRSWSVDRKQ